MKKTVQQFTLTCSFVVCCYGLIACEQKSTASQSERTRTAETKSSATEVAKVQPVQTLVPSTELDKTQWQLQKIFIEQDKPQLLLPGTVYTLTFDKAEGKLKGKVDCNHYFASVVVDQASSTITVKDLSTTEMICQRYSEGQYSAIAYQKQINIYRSGLLGFSQYKSSGNTLNLYSENGMQLIFLKAEE